jgi:hypothetical protein
MTKSTSQLFTKRAFKYFKPFILLGETLFFTRKTKMRDLERNTLRAGDSSYASKKINYFNFFFSKSTKMDF